ncbi:MAG: response regulator transcription factor [Anaerolineales bacterium]|nr:response regulator transcription factor [Anaerolineales bacterium]
MNRQRILVVDDDREVVRLMRAYLEQAGYEVLVAYDGDTAVHALRRDKPDLLLLDLMLPGKDGWEITRLMRADAALAAIPIIMLTARVDDTDKIVGLELGADDYVTKPYNPREVVARVRARLRTPGSLLPQQLQVGGLQMDLGRHEVRLHGRLVDLTPTEYNLLHVLLEQAGQVFTRGELITRGLGADYEGLERTLDSHIRNLRQKIEPDPRQPTYIQTVYGVGYRLAEETT